MQTDYELSYIINQLGEDRENYFNAVAPPVIQTSSFAFKTVADMRQGMKHEDEIPFYTRGANPTTDILRKKMAALENTEDCLAFASGSAAIAAGILAFLKQGDHVVCVDKPYSWTKKLLVEWLPRFGVQTTFVDGKDPENFRKAIRPETRLFYLESPNSWTFEIQDFQAITAIAKEHGLVTLADNSYASPVNMNPADYGVDVILHSATKYISGHSDSVAGILCSSKEITTRIFKSEFMTLGGVISPFNAWLLLRGLRTLPVRMTRIAETTMQIVNYMSSHPKVETIYYPFSKSHPQYDLACRQMKRGGGQFTIALKTSDPDEVEKFCNSLKRFLLAASWGSYESLVFPAITQADSMNYSKGALPLNFIRFYIGLEDPGYLIEDLNQALSKI